MEIRKVLPTDDFVAISRIYASSWRVAYKGIVSQKFLDERSDDRWADILRNSTNDNFVMIQNGEYIGTSGVCPARDEKMNGWGEISSIYLLPEYYGKGFGKPLLENSISALVEKGYTKIYLWVLEKNIMARKFYEKNGFLPYDSAVINIGGDDLTEVRYILEGKQ